MSSVQIDREALAHAATRAVRSGDTSWVQIADRCGWHRQSNHDRGASVRGNGQRVRELLHVPGARPTKRDLTYDEAYSLVLVLGLDPVDIGL